jgi:hypothetical protein
VNVQEAIRVPLYQLAHARAGDKGNRLNIALFAYQPEYFELLAEQVTEAAVARQFAHRRPSSVTRYLLPNLAALNFVLDDVLEGGVNNSLTLDRHGKGLSFLLLELSVSVPQKIAEALVIHQRRQS